MPDTKITRTNDGWIDVDQPTIFHKVRRLARAARRAARGSVRATPLPRMVTRNVVVGAVSPTATMTPDLQARALNRMVQDLGMDFNEAYDVVAKYTYNKSVSYAHMRRAGASSAEATIVIDLDNPALSRTYGLCRGRGMNHTDALAEALKDDD